MKIINPSVEIITETDPLKKIELCGRVCYKSEEKITGDSAKTFIKKIIERGHTSVLEHEMFGIHFSLSYTHLLSQMHAGFIDDKSGQHAQPSRHFISDGNTLFANIRAWREICQEQPFNCPFRNKTLTAIKDSEYSPFFEDIEFVKYEHGDCFVVYPHHQYQSLTVRFICDRGVSHELVRHRVASFSQESTRYCDYKGEMEFIKPCFDWAEDIPKGIIKDIGTKDYSYLSDLAWRWILAMQDSETSYGCMRAGYNKSASPQEARSVLPNSLKTEVIMTAIYREWEGILNLRLAPAAHPQMRQVIQMLIEHKDFPKDIKYRSYEK